VFPDEAEASRVLRASLAGRAEREAYSRGSQPSEEKMTAGHARRRRLAPEPPVWCISRRNGERKAVIEDARVLAVDIGGTHTRFALYDAHSDEPEPVMTPRSVASDASQRFDAILAEFLRFANSPALGAVCIGAAGPIVDGRVTVTNLGWQLDAEALSVQLGAPVRLCNDLETTAFGMLQLPDSAFMVLQAGTRPRGRGNVAVVAAGTGFGEAVLVATEGGHRPSATETGHTGFAPRNLEERELLAFLAREHPRVSLEHVVSGPGLRRLVAFAVAQRGGNTPPEVLAALAEADPNAAIVRQARAGEPCCAAALERFVACYGAAAGDAALRHLALGGVLIGGGIGPKLRAELAGEGFLAAFRDKGPYRELVESLPVALCIAPSPALLGAAGLARALVGS
jgi:glucokinase